MVRVDSTWQNIIFVAFLVTWFGGTFVLYGRTYVKQRAYLRHFAREYAFLAGEPLFDTPRTFRGYRVVSRLMCQRQSDPQLEELRWEMWRRNSQMILWMFGFLIVCLGVMALLVVTGVVTLTA